MDLYTGKCTYQILWLARKSELYSTPKKYTSAKLHSQKVKTWHNKIREQIPLKDTNYWIKKNLESAILSIPVERNYFASFFSWKAASQTCNPEICKGAFVTPQSIASLTTCSSAMIRLRMTVFFHMIFVLHTAARLSRDQVGKTELLSPCILGHSN